MANTIPHDKSCGYEQVAETFIRARNRGIGGSTAREWSKLCRQVLRSSISDVVTEYQFRKC